MGVFAYPRNFGDSGTRARPGWGTTISQQARKKLGLRRLPQLLADADSPAKTATACDAIAKTVKTIFFFINVMRSSIWLYLANIAYPSKPLISTSV